MSNRVNRALANAWLASDKAVSERAFKKEQAVALAAWDTATKAAAEELKAYEDDRSLWETVGSFVGATAGAALGFFTGGPAGAIKGGMQGYSMGDDLFAMGFDLDSYHIDKALASTTAVREFDYQFSPEARKYKYIRESGIDPFKEKQEAAKKAAGKDYDIFADEYDKGVFEVILDEGVGMYGGYVSGAKLFDLTSSNLAWAADSKLGQLFRVDDLESWGQSLQDDWMLDDFFNIPTPEEIGEDVIQGNWRA